MKYRLPAFTNQRTFAEAGALASYSASFAERARGIASYVDRISREPKVPICRWSSRASLKWSSTLKTAKEFGLTIPATMLARTDEVIE